LPHAQAAVSLVALQKSNRVGAPPSPLPKPSQNGPRRPGSAAPRPNGAPLTAPGRSEENLPDKRERRVGKFNDPASKHLATSPARPRTRYYASRYLRCGRGAGCRNFSRLPARGGAFPLDILFYRNKVAARPGEGEKVDHLSRWRAVLGTCDAKWGFRRSRTLNPG
jgi:hypothetical protein